MPALPPIQLAALKLIDQGKLSLDTPVSKYFPQLATPTKYIASLDASGSPVYGTTDVEVTVRLLMNQARLSLALESALPGPKADETQLPASPLADERLRRGVRPQGHRVEEAHDRR